MLKKSEIISMELLETYSELTPIEIGTMNSYVLEDIINRLSEECIQNRKIKENDVNNKRSA